MQNTVLISGITGGIGQATAMEFLKHKWKVFGTYAHAGEKVETLKSEEPEVTFIRCDFENPVEVADTIRKGLAGATPSLLVNCAGITSDNFFANMSLSEWKRVVNVNLISSLYLTKLVLPMMEGNGSGRVISISSISGIYGRETQSNYATTKGGLIGLTQLIEHSKNNASHIEAITIAPGMINTDITNAVSPKKMKLFLQALINKRTGLPREVGKLIYELSLPSLSYLNGAIVPIDGGLFK
ncbi:MAG: SDR family oxidoreductase [Sporolactobacillus sp.]